MAGRSRRDKSGAKSKSKRNRTDDLDDEYTLSVSLNHFLDGPGSFAINADVETVVERPSADGRRTYTEMLPVAPPSPVKRMRQQAHGPAMGADDDPPLPTFDAFQLELDSDRYHMDLGGVFDRPATPPSQKLPGKGMKKFMPSDKSLYDWRRLRDAFLQETIRLEGCAGASEDVCPGCGGEAPTIRCKQCFGGDLFCVGCCVSMHAANPLHITDAWDGSFFRRTSLRDIGLRVALHHPGCKVPATVENFVVMELGYIHEVTVDFCGCEKRHSTDRWIELIRKRWFPATHHTPRSAATFNCLNFFVIQTHQAKTTMYDFYTATERATWGSGQRPFNRYPEFLRMVREWRHLQMLRRGGRRHDPSGVNGTAPGALAVQCPACPRPDVNLPAGWEDTSPEDRFLYFFFLALDACFRLKRRMVSSELRDPGLGTGWAYFVEQEPYRQYLLTATNETEMSTCSGLAALDYANTKFSRGYSTTGVGMGVCARHEFVQPTGVGDLQKGERYSNMDWIFSAIMRWKHERLFKVVSYDIICQWFKHLFERLLNMPSTVRFVIVMALMRFVIPKMHIHSHTLACQLLFSLNFLLGAGQTDGEGIERPWANLGGVATSTREMGPGSRRDTLDSHLGYWNWTKLIGIAGLLRRRLDKAKLEETEQTVAYEAFTLEQGERAEEWRKMVHAWEANPKEPNPYEMKARGTTEAEVRLKLSEEEAERAKAAPPLHDISPSGFIYGGLELEEQQRRVRVSIELKRAQTTAQKIDIVAMRRKLSRGIARFRKLQATYTPAALQALGRRTAEPDEMPEHTPLMLPSALTEEEREGGCVGGVVYVEALARDAQCEAALLRVRHQLHIKSRFTTYKRIHSRHQGANTRSRTIIARNESKIRLHSEKYQAAWDAIRRLQGGDATKVGGGERERERERARARQLVAEGERVEDDDGEEGWEDVAEGDEAGAGQSTTESRRVVSWIWTTAGTTGSDAELEEALRIEWAKAYARSRRWKEEIRLLEEEYRRILVSFEYEEARWKHRAAGVSVGEAGEEFAQGAIAYALRQADMYRDIRERAVVTMTEIRRGRGKKRLPAAALGAGEGAGADGVSTAGAQGGRNELPGARTEGERENADRGAAEDEGSDDDGDDGDDSDAEGEYVDSDEEFLLGGEDEGY
ncbi:hypothetical protein C8F04DRAFT_1271407 [Mycena alexandri]|uniref:CxC2-like cysteine cluster KDZ transposase-associated domain-containing protein n=1 Tax=Mycena alexandri TaxID=1745969 RepID=A0AAD6WSH6_9AGAR|nr:hypothetical protein C8F04DRAFT_1271407 [Mycena alexandri]